MGLKPEDTVLIHSSMKSIGQVDGGADAVLEALEEYFAPGLLVFPALTYNTVTLENPLFSEKETPCCIGLLPEMFRKRPRTQRSLHPSHSLCAAGREAKDFLAGHENFDSPAHRDSPWGKLYDRDAYILFIGTGISCNTFLHSVEEWLPVPGMLTEEKWPLVIETADGRRLPCPSRRHVGAHSRYYALMEQPFRSGKALTDGRFGDAHVHILRARPAGDITLEQLRHIPLFFTQEYQEKC